MNLNTSLKRIENQNFSFPLGFLSLLAVILTRNILESAFEGSQTLGFSPIAAHSFYMVFVHFSLFYISIFLWLLFVLVLFTKENWVKVAKALLIGMSVIIITPIIDIVISKGSGYKLTYLRDFEQFTEIHKFFDFTRDVFQASWGQRIEILLSLIGGFVYVLIKTKNYLKSIIASIIIYLLIFLHGVIPNVIAKIPSYLGSNLLSYRTIITNGILPIDSQNYAVIFSISIIFAGFFILRKADNGFIKKLFNFKSSGLSIICLCLGTTYAIFLTIPYYKYIFYSPISYLIFLLAIFSCTFINSATSINELSWEFQAIIIACLFFALSLGPIFLLLITIFFLFKKFIKVRWLALIPSFIAGFSIIYQGDTFRTIIPINRSALEIRGRKMAGWCYFLNTDYEQALNQYLKAYTLNKDDEITKRLGQSYLNFGDINEGIEILEKISDPDYETFLSLGQIYFQKAEYDKAVKICERAIEKNITPADFYIKIAQISARMRNEQMLNQAADKSLLYGSPKYKTYQIKGDFYLGNEDQKRAFDAYQKALYYNPRDIASLAGTGIISYNRGDFTHAEEQFLKSLKIEPDNDAVYNNLGVTYLITKRYEKAEQYFLKSIKKNPNQTEAYYNLGLIYENAGKAKDALEMYNKALKVNPSYPQALKKIQEIK